MAETPTDEKRGLAVITGASTGIGRAVAVALAERGWPTALVARNAEKLESLAGELRPYARSYACPADLLQSGEVGALMQQIEREHGPVAVLVNNAGFGDNRRFLDVPMAKQREMFEVNYFATAEAIYALLPGMLEAGYGRVINIASMATKAFPAGMSAYAASKSAMAALTYGLASEYRSADVRFCCVHPGIIRTDFFNDPVFKPMTPMIHRHGISPERVAKAVVKLIDRPRLHTCVPRWHKIVDWLRALSPGFMAYIGARSGHPAAASPPASSVQAAGAAEDDKGSKRSSGSLSGAAQPAPPPPRADSATPTGADAPPARDPASRQSGD